MKKSHRKDVIIARIIFGFILLILIAALACLGIAISKSYKAKKAADEATVQVEPENPGYQPELIEPDTSTEINGTEALSDDNNTETESDDADSDSDSDSDTNSDKKQVWVTGNINLRSKPSTDASVIKTVTKADKLYYLGEEGDFVKVDYNGTTGYLYKDYVTEKKPN